MPPSDIYTEPEAADGSSPLALLRIIWERRAVVAACTVLVIVGALAYSLAADKSYTAETQLRLRDPAFAKTIFGSDVFEAGIDPARDASTNVEIITSTGVSQRVAAALPGSESADELADAVEVAAGDNSDILTISVTTADPQLSARVANAYAEQYKAFQQEADRQAVRDAQQLVRRSLRQATGAEETGLQESLQQLTVLEAVQTGNANIIASAQPPVGPSSPKPVRNVLLAGALGLLLGTGIALLLDLLDRRLKTDDDFAAAFGHPVIVSVPLDAIASSRTGRLSGAAAEPYRMLRESLRFLEVSGATRCVLVTSPDAGEGKTTVAVNLARVLVDGGQRVILIEADMRRPAAARELRVEARSPGLSGALVSQVSIRELLVDAKGVGILPCGSHPPNPAELLRMARMRQILMEARELADIVIVDTPPLLPVSDTRALLSAEAIDGVLLVGMANATRRDRAREASRVLAQVGRRVLGCVITASGEHPNEYYYGAYGGGSPPGPPSAAETGVPIPQGSKRLSPPVTAGRARPTREPSA